MFCAVANSFSNNSFTDAAACCRDGFHVKGDTLYYRGPSAYEILASLSRRKEMKGNVK
jgi:hypothetical protein